LTVVVAHHLESPANFAYLHVIVVDEVSLGAVLVLQDK
jgi:hypothetical protein